MVLVGTAKFEDKCLQKSVTYFINLVGSVEGKIEELGKVCRILI